MQLGQKKQRSPHPLQVQCCVEKLLNFSFVYYIQTIQFSAESDWVHFAKCVSKMNTFEIYSIVIPESWFFRSCKLAHFVQDKSELCGLENNL